MSWESCPSDPPPPQPQPQQKEETMNPDYEPLLAKRDTDTEPKQPKWVEAANCAFEVLERAKHEDDANQASSLVNQAHAWMRLSEIYKGSNFIPPA